MAVRFEIASETAYIAPALEVVVRVDTVIAVNNFGEVPEEQRERSPGTNYSDRHVMPVQNKNIAV